MAEIKIRKSRCKGCGLCVTACPKSIIKMSSKINKSGYPVVEVTDMQECTGCTFCAEMCPDAVITVFR